MLFLKTDLNDVVQTTFDKFIKSIVGDLINVPIFSFPPTALADI